MPANDINGPGIHELIESDCCYCYRILREREKTQNEQQKKKKKKSRKESYENCPERIKGVFFFYYHNSKTFCANPERKNFQGICDQHGRVSEIVEGKKQKDEWDDCCTEII